MTKKDDFDVLFSSVANAHRTILERTWFRNILYYIGEQWIVWGNGDTFDFAYKYASGIPTPISDIIRDHVRSMKALIVNKKISIGVAPNSDELSDVDGAKLAEKLAEHLRRADDYNEMDVVEMCAMMTIITGNGFIRTMPDPNSGKYILGINKKPVINMGEISTVARMPFDIFVPDSGSRLKDKKMVGIRTLADREWVEDTFKVDLSKASGDRKVADYQRQLTTLVANVSPWKASGIEAGISTNDDDSVIIDEIEYKPTMEYPKGRWVAKCCGVELFSNDELPVPVGKDGGWDYSVTHFSYDYTPGSFWAMGSIDMLISPQDTINRIDQSLEINRESIGKPFVLTPSELVLKRLSRRGAKVLQLQYDGRTSGGLRPEIHQGVPMPEQMFTDRINRLQTAQNASGNPKNILSGSSPFAGAAGVAIDILRESAEQGHTPDVDRFYRRLGSVKRKQLVIAQKVYTESRLLKVVGDGNNVYVKKFKGSDLRDNTDVIIELISGLSFTKSGTTSMLMESIQYGLWRNDVVNPEIRRELLSLMGLSGIKETDNIHRNRAEYENSLLASSDEPTGIALISAQEEQSDTAIEDIGGMPLDTGEMGAEMSDKRFRMDDHRIHMEVLDKLIFSREFSALSEIRQDNIIGHRDLHAAALAQQQDANSELQQGMEAEAGATLGGMNNTSVAEMEGPAVPATGELPEEMY